MAAHRGREYENAEMVEMAIPCPPISPCPAITLTDSWFEMDSDGRDRRAANHSALDAESPRWWHRRHLGAGLVMAYGGPHLPQGVREGVTVLGKYRIGATLGWGAMGTVVAARHLHLDKDIAIKFLKPEAVDHLESRTRFYREARAADRIRSEHVVRVFDVGALDSGEPYIVMEYLHGCDLAAWLQRHGPLPVDEAVDFVLQACEAIAQAHEQGIVHRDLKPANLFVVERPGKEPLIKVLDFGIAKNTGLLSTTLPPSDCAPEPVITEERALMGTPYYMSPEQLNSSHEVDGRTDVWALGVVLFELVTGKVPFPGTFLDVCARIAAPLRPREQFPDLSPRLETVLLKCLERDRDRRYPTAKELADALRSLGSREAVDEEGATLQSARGSRTPTVELRGRSVRGAVGIGAIAAVMFIVLAKMPMGAKPAASTLDTAAHSTATSTPAPEEPPSSHVRGTQSAGDDGEDAMPPPAAYAIPGSRARSASDAESPSPRSASGSRGDRVAPAAIPTLRVPSSGAPAATSPSQPALVWPPDVRK